MLVGAALLATACGAERPAVAIGSMAVEPPLGSEAESAAPDANPGVDGSTPAELSGGGARSESDPDGPETMALDPELARTSGVIVAEATTDRIVARTAPHDEAGAVAELANPTAVGGPLVFQAVDPVYRPDREWIEVLLPVRPNGTTGWIRTDEVTLTRNRYVISIDVAEHRLQVHRDGALLHDTEVAIGTGATPTPIGAFYVIELLEPPSPDGPYGPFAFGLSGFSETLTEFGGGDGVIGIHGTDAPESLGTDVSHGCVRVANDVITQLAAELPLGTPVFITD